ncbi:unnamed protein product, partial [Vitis vinifera]|uniref:Uncharacterized protein n=1 Tax=Vitis vinifera TaxID=29760 RepID=D7SI81_VITVI
MNKVSSSAASNLLNIGLCVIHEESFRYVSVAYIVISPFAVVAYFYHMVGEFKNPFFQVTTGLHLDLLPESMDM